MALARLSAGTTTSRSRATARRRDERSGAQPPLARRVTAAQGEAWLEAWKLDPNVELYGPDRFHPSPLGTYAAALVMYEQLRGADARDVAGIIPGYPDAAPSASLDVVRRAARRANDRLRREPR